VVDRGVEADVETSRRRTTMHLLLKLYASMLHSSFQFFSVILVLTGHFILHCEAGSQVTFYEQQDCSCCTRTSSFLLLVYIAVFAHYSSICHATVFMIQLWQPHPVSVL